SYANRARQIAGSNGRGDARGSVSPSTSARTSSSVIAPDWSLFNQPDSATWAYRIGFCGRRAFTHARTSSARSRPYAPQPRSRPDSHSRLAPGIAWAAASTSSAGGSVTAGAGGVAIGAGGATPPAP